MNQLSNKIAVVVGGAGNVGEGIVRALLAEGAEVVVPSRSADRLTKLTHYVETVQGGQLHTVLTDVSVPDQANRLRDDVLSQFGRLDMVVASLGGGWWQGTPLLTVPMTPMATDNTG